MATRRSAVDHRVLLLASAASQLARTDEARSFLNAVCAGDSQLEEDVTRTIGDIQLPAGSSISAFSAGQLIADRFRIIRRLGEGGMAVVYEALDTKLRERRALKFPKDGHSHSIPPEARSAMRVTHNNICRIHEIHTTETGDGTIDLISMELVEGETLAARCRREPVPHAMALDIALQLCRGIEAAHDAQILHRDLKSSNVMLSSYGDGSLRVVVTDFGLARAFGGDRSPSTFVSGTPDYIAPECWKGYPASPASDVYALGVILHELLTGRMPFVRGSDWARRISSLPDPPSRSDRGPDRRWDRIVLGCLEPEPGKRYASATEVRQAVERAFLRSYRRQWLIAAAVAVLSITPVAVFRDRIWPAPLARLAVLPVPGSTGDRALDETVRGSLSDLARRLESVGAPSRRLAVIPFEDSLGNEVDSTADAVARLGATHTLSVTLASAGDALAVSAVVADGRNGELLRQFTGNFNRREIAALSTTLTGVVTSAFHLPNAPSVPVAPAAYGHYAAGLAALRRSERNYENAIEELQQALAIDADAPLIRSALAEALLNKFNVTKDPRWLAEASALARRAETLLPDSAEVLLVRGRLEQEEGRPERAIELFHRAAELEPNSSEAWKRVGAVFQTINRDAEATAALRRAVQLDPGYYSPHLYLGNVHFRMGRYSEAVEQYQKAVELAPDLPEAHANLGGALIAAERDAEAEYALRRSLKLRETSRALNNLSIVLRYQERDREAVQVLSRALEVGAEDPRLRLNLANALRRIGRAKEARENFQRANELARQSLRTDPRNATARAQLAFSMAGLGLHDMAADEALQAVRLGSSQYSVLFWAVMTLEAAGRRDDALPLLTSASLQQLRDFRRQPDLAEFSRDARFRALLASRAAFAPQPDTRK